MKISLMFISVFYLRSGRWWNETFCNGWPIDRVCRTWKYQPGGIPKAKRCRILIARRGKLLGLIPPLKLKFVCVLNMLFVKFDCKIVAKKLDNKQNWDQFLAAYSSLLIGKVFLFLIKHHHTEISVSFNTINIKHINKNNIICSYEYWSGWSSITKLFNRYVKL